MALLLLSVREWTSACARGPWIIRGAGVSGVLPVCRCQGHLTAQPMEFPGFKMFQFGIFQPHLIFDITFNVWTCNCMPLRFHHSEWGAKLVKKTPILGLIAPRQWEQWECSDWILLLLETVLQSHTTHLIWDYTVFNNGASRCAREHGTDTQHPELLPAFPSGFVIASAARSAYIVSWDKVMSLAGFTFHHYHLGICVLDPSVLPAVGTQSRETAGPAQGVSKLHAIQKGCSLFRFVLAEEERQLYLSSFTWTIIVFVVCELITCLHKNCSVNKHEFFPVTIFGILSFVFLEVLHFPVFYLYLSKQLSFLSISW